MIAPALFALAAQQLVPPPAPPAPRTDETEVLRYADTLRATCLSERGVALAVTAWRRWHADDPARLTREVAVRDEVGAAANAKPVDVDRLDRALADQRRQQSDWFAANDANSIALLRELSPADRAIFAGRLTIMHPAIPARTCPVPVRR